MSGRSQRLGSSTVRSVVLLCFVFASCTRSADTGGESPTTTEATSTSPAATLVDEAPPQTQAVEPLSISVVGLPDEVLSYQRVSIGFVSNTPECRFELDAPELLWVETDDRVNFEFNAPIVYQASEEFSIHLRSTADSNCPLETQTLGLTVNQAEMKFDDPALNPGFLSTDHYRVADLGFGGVEVTETYTATLCYPTPDDCYLEEDQVFGPDAQNMATGDFNNDGFEDIVVAWYFSPHHIEEDQKVFAPVHIYLNDGNGHLYEDTSMFLDGAAITHPFAYRLVVGDFNADGFDDVFAGSMGLQVRYADYSRNYIDPYPHVLLLSNEDGKFSDASGNIDDENQGQGMQCGFAHDASGGDFDNDGDIDIYACNILLVNDGSGRFAMHPFVGLGWQERYGNPMSSLVLDVNNDDYDDLLFWNPDDRDFERSPEEGLILLSDGSANVAAWQAIPLPAGPFGDNNNKYNHAAGGDLNNDGFADAVVAITRADPYYEGAYVQVLINDGTGALEDQTSDRFSSQPRADAFRDGEANIYLRDLDDDGDLDIFHSMHRSVELGGIHIAINDGSGHFTPVGDEYLPSTPRTYEYEPDEDQPLTRGLPIDLDGRGCLDLISSSITYFDDATWVRNYLFAIINTDCEGL